MDFFQTVGGQRFIQGTMPQLTQNLGLIAKELKRGNDLKEKENMTLEVKHPVGTIQAKVVEGDYPGIHITIDGNLIAVVDVSGSDISVCTYTKDNDEPYSRQTRNPGEGK